MALPTYTVKRGDNLTKIADGRCGKNVAASISGSTVSAKINTLVKLNNIKNRNLIYVGQVLKLSGSASSSSSSSTKTNVPTITAFGLQSDDTTGRAMYIAWSYSRSNLKNFKVRWSHYKDGQWWTTDQETSTGEAVFCNDTYSADEGATKVKVKILPQSDTNNEGKPYWTDTPWSAEKVYDFSDNPPYPPSVPSIEIKELTLTASIDNIDAAELNADSVEFEIIKNNSASLGSYAAKINTATNYVSYMHTVDAGAEYKVRARCKKGSKVSGWTDFTGNEGTKPATPSSITTCRANSYSSDEITAYLEWTTVTNAETYDIEYTTNKNYFDGTDGTTSVTGIEFNHYEITSLELGKEYFFRVRAVNQNGESDWSEIKSAVLGTTPIAPTTWSSTTVSVVGEPLNLYWVHNSEDNSSETYAEIRLYVDGVLQSPDITVKNSPSEYGENLYNASTAPILNTYISTSSKLIGAENEVDNLTYLRIEPNTTYKITKLAGVNFSIGTCPNEPTYNTSLTVAAKNPDGTEMIITSGESDNYLAIFYCNVNNDTISEEEIRNSIVVAKKLTITDYDKDKTKVYALDTTDYPEGTKLKWQIRTAGITKVYGEWSIERVIDIYAKPTLALAVTTSPDGTGDIINTLTSFPFYIYALPGPKTQYPIGYQLKVTANQYYETIDETGVIKIVNAGEDIYSKHFDTTNALIVEMSADNIDIEADIEYTITCSVTMNSGLTTETSHDFVADWDDVAYNINADVTIDHETLTALINPFCEDEEGSLVEDLTLSVYRREFDGTFKELARNIPNTNSVTISDPHPALDYARYRIVGRTISTGAVSYHDIPGVKVGGKAVIIQWNDEWSVFDATDEYSVEKPKWAGSMLSIPYNIDTSDNNSRDVEFVQYIGRKYPVAYHGTQLGSTATWNVEIPKDDKDTLYAIRRLQIWNGVAYVREPSGSGYWANVTVSYNQTHKEVTIPITFTITRVEGGI